MSSASTIESILVENRVFPPPMPGHRRARASRAWPPTTRCARKPQTTSRASGPAWRASNVVWTKPFTRTLDESNAPFYKWFDDGELNASANCLDKHIGTPVENKTAIIFEADDGTVTKVTYKELLARVSPVRQCAEGAGHQEGRPRHHLHADDHRRRDRDAGLRAHRRHPQRGVRRLLGQGAAGAHHRRRRGGGDHGQLPDARRQGAAAQGHRRRRHRAGRLRLDQDRAGLPAHADRLQHGGRPRQDLRRGAPGPGHRVRAGAGGRRAPALHPLHLGLHRQAQGRAALHRRLPAVGQAHDGLDLRHRAPKTCSGAPPTSAGSPATPTSPTVRWPRARRRWCSRASRPFRTRAASGR